MHGKHIIPTVNYVELLKAKAKEMAKASPEKEVRTRKSAKKSSAK
jgi:hypothetical protein